MKKRKVNGFTLIEFLIVILLLGIMAVIIVPKISKSLKETENKTHINSTYGLIEAAELYYADIMMHGSEPYGGDVLPKLKIAGKKPDSGYVIVDSQGEIAVGVIYDNMCYTKKFYEKKVKLDKNSACSNPPDFQ